MGGVAAPTLLRVIAELLLGVAALAGAGRRGKRVGSVARAAITVWSCGRGLGSGALVSMALLALPLGHAWGVRNMAALASSVRLCGGRCSYGAHDGLVAGRTGSHPFAPSVRFVATDAVVVAVRGLSLVAAVAARRGALSVWRVTGKAVRVAARSYGGCARSVLHMAALATARGREDRVILVTGLARLVLRGECAGHLLRAPLLVAGHTELRKFRTATMGLVAARAIRVARARAIGQRASRARVTARAVLAGVLPVRLFLVGVVAQHAAPS
jgi:hypothetical protein